MNNYIVDLTINDVLCNKCCKETNQRTITITQLSQRVGLQCDYILNVLNVTGNTVTILIQNGVFALIRNISTNYDMEICLPNKCNEHVVTIGAKIYEA